MNIIFVNRYFYPDHDATNQMLTDLAFFMGGWLYRLRHHQQAALRRSGGKPGAIRALPWCWRVSGFDGALRTVEPVRARQGSLENWLPIQIGFRRWA